MNSYIEMIERAKAYDPETHVAVPISALDALLDKCWHLTEYVDGRSQDTGEVMCGQAFDEIHSSLVDRLKAMRQRVMLLSMRELASSMAHKREQHMDNRVCHCDECETKRELRALNHGGE